MSFEEISKTQRAVILRFMINHKDLVKNGKNKGGKCIQAANVSILKNLKINKLIYVKIKNYFC